MLRALMTSQSYPILRDEVLLETDIETGTCSLYAYHIKPPSRLRQTKSGKQKFDR